MAEGDAIVKNAGGHQEFGAATPRSHSITAAHSFPGGTTDYLREDGTWHAPAGGGGGALEVKEVDGAPDVADVTVIRVSNGTLTDDGGGQVTITTGGGGGSESNRVARLDPGNAPGGANDDEFEGSSLDAAWTTTQNSTARDSISEKYGVVNFAGISNAGGNIELSVITRALTPSVGDYIETAVDFWHAFAYKGACLIFSDGTTYGAGNQVIFWWFYYDSNQYASRLDGFTNFNNTAANADYTARSGHLNVPVYLRLKYQATNTWRGYWSLDGIYWYQTGADLTYTMTPTRAGLGVVHYQTNNANDGFASFHYFRVNPA